MGFGFYEGLQLVAMRFCLLRALGWFEEGRESMGELLVN